MNKAASILKAKKKLKIKEFINMVNKTSELSAHCGVGALFIQYVLYTDVIYDIIPELEKLGYVVRENFTDKTITVSWAD